MDNNYLKTLEAKLEEKVKFFVNKLDQVHINRINLDFIGEKIKIEKKPLKKVAGCRITPRQELVIYNFEPKMLTSIRNAVLNNELGYGFRSSQETATEIYFVLNSLTKEKRDKFISQAELIQEEGKVALRGVREVFRNAVKKDAKLSQDQKRNYENQIDKIKKDYEDKLIEAKKKKVKELSS